MSRIGKKPIEIPSGVTINLERNLVSVNGPKGSLNLEIPVGVKVETKENRVIVTRASDEGRPKALHGTIRQVLSNMVKGVSEGWSKTLEIVGTGFRPTQAGEKLILSLGFSHPVEILPVEGITLTAVENKIIVTGADKVLVGQIAAKIRDIKRPDAYKGKGIRYAGEVIKLKPGKQAKIGTVAGGAKAAK